jgi:hypothetical protein
VGQDGGHDAYGLLLACTVTVVRSIRLGVVLLGFIVGSLRDAGAQAGTQTLQVEVNVPYAVQFGFGSYDVGGLSVDVFRIPITHTFALGTEREAWALALTVYPGYGHASFESRALGPRITASEDVVFLMSRAELEIPLRRWWTVKPYVEAGLGRAFGGSVAVDGQTVGHVDDLFFALYAGGISNLFEVQVQDFLLSFGTKLAAAGDADIGRSGSDGYGSLQNGLEVRHPLGVRIKDLVPDVGVSFIHYYFFPSAKFSLPGQRPLEVSNQFEFGVSVGFAAPSRLWIFENPRIGVSYRFGDGLTGVRVNFGFPF